MPSRDIRDAQSKPDYKPVKQKTYWEKQKEKMKGKVPIAARLGK